MIVTFVELRRRYRLTVLTASLQLRRHKPVVTVLTASLHQSPAH